jgi:hypothetical protein
VITEFIITVLTAPFELVLNLIPAFEFPSVFSSAVAVSSAGMNTVGKVCFFIGEKIGLLGSWIDGAMLITVAPIVGVTWAFYLAVKGLRMVLSVVSGGGGAV